MVDLMPAHCRCDGRGADDEHEGLRGVDARPDLRHPFLSGQDALPVDPRVAAAAAERVVEPPDEFLVGARIADEGPRLEGSVGGHAAVGGDRSPPCGCWYPSARSGSAKSR